MRRWASDRRQCTAALLSTPFWGLAFPARALVESDAAAGVRAALERAAAAAVATLGRRDGFAAHPRLRIGLPPPLDAAAPLLRATGQGRRVDELELAINRAAETAVGGSLDLLRQAVRGMTVEDALGLVRGGETGITDFFARKTRAPLSQRFAPLVAQATRRHALAEQYNALAGRAAAAGLLGERRASLEAHVTAHALDGLYHTIGEEEQRLRRDPAAAGSALLRRVFGR